MSTKKTNEITKICNVVDKDGVVLGTIEVNEIHFRWRPDEGDGWSNKEIKTMYQDTIEYRVYSQCLPTKIVKEHK